jgi:exonuclease III
MRLVSWNANYNRYRRSLDDTVALLAGQEADLLVLSETGKPHAGSALDFHFAGGAPGLAVVSRHGLELEPHSENDAVPDYMAGYRVLGADPFDLVAIWPVSRPDEFSYHEVLMSALDHYSDILGGGRAVMIGDFNSSTRVRAQARTHEKFVAAAAELGLASLYHWQTGEHHGMETISTYRHSSGAIRDFRIDYCFVSQRLLGASRLEVLRDESWMRLSDHFPLVAEVDFGAAP